MAVRDGRRRVGPVEIVLTPVQHWSGRRLDDRMRTLWGGYAVFATDFHVYFAGDTGYSRGLRGHARALRGSPDAERGGGFDLALLPIGAYEPRWFMRPQHMNPAEALQAQPGPRRASARSASTGARSR